jgi:uncharacterized protein
MTQFTPISALFGGILIGCSVLLLWLLDGRIAGVSGILGRLIGIQRDERFWRAAFLLGLLLAPSVYALVHALPPLDVAHSVPLLVIAGLLVGFGTRLGNGCTSGHGVCGVARLSKRSIVATCTFMAAGAITVFVARHLIGG